jgi:hypothetical protein
MRINPMEVLFQYVYPSHKPEGLIAREVGRRRNQWISIPDSGKVDSLAGSGGNSKTTRQPVDNL